MPRYFFHVYTDEVALDEEGAFLSNVQEAHEQAIISARELAAHEVLGGHLGLNHRIEVTDLNGGAVATVHFKDAVQLHP